MLFGHPAALGLQGHGVAGLQGMETKFGDGLEVRFEKEPPLPCGDAETVDLPHGDLADVDAYPLLPEVLLGLRTPVYDDAVGHVDAGVAGAFETNSKRFL